MEKTLMEFRFTTICSAEYARLYGYQKAQYRVSSLEGREYYDWQYDNETHSGQDGYAGKLGVAIDKFQLF